MSEAKKLADAIEAHDARHASEDSPFCARHKRALIVRDCRAVRCDECKAEDAVE